MTAGVAARRFTEPVSLAEYRDLLDGVFDARVTAMDLRGAPIEHPSWSPPRNDPSHIPYHN